MAITKEELLAEYALFHYAQPGVGALVGPQMHRETFERLSELDHTPLTKVQLNQLLVLSQAGSMSDGFFRYYWLTQPEHPYDISNLPYHPSGGVDENRIEVVSHNHLRWGLYRFYVDGLLYFGNISVAYAALRSRSFEQLKAFFGQKRFDTDAIANRGPALPLQEIAKDDRYLISEMVCKTFGDLPEEKEKARNLLLNGLRKLAGGKKTEVCTWRTVARLPLKERERAPRAPDKYNSREPRPPC